MKAEIVLTVAESKRLIAKGVVQLDFIQEKLKEGIVVLPTGSTNAYIYEELTGQAINKAAYLTGRTAPSKSKIDWPQGPLPDLVLVNGEPDPSLDRVTALEKMRPGDVFIKGANALNYAAGIAGVAIGDPRGGTVGKALGTIIGNKLRLLIPVGLEKEVPYDIMEASALIAEPDDRLGPVHSLWPVQGMIFTEIEALELLCGVSAIPVGAGGIAGAEGGVRLLLMGEPSAIRQAMDLVDGIQGEPPFL